MSRVEPADRFAVVRLLALGLMTLVGCGPSSGRLAISGKVTLDGEPLDEGAIRFTSLGGDEVFASGAMIRNGEYHIPRDKGLPPGTYHLEITAADAEAPPITMRNTPGGPGTLTSPERIPPEYNIESEKTIEVTADGKNQFNFDIVTPSH